MSNVHMGIDDRATLGHETLCSEETGECRKEFIMQAACFHGFPDHQIVFSSGVRLCDVNPEKRRMVKRR